MSYFLSIICGDLFSALMLCLVFAMFFFLWKGKHNFVWRGLFPFFIVLGFLLGRFSIVSLLPVSLLGLCSYLVITKDLSSWQSFIINCFIGIVSFGLMFHVFHGFVNWQVIHGVVISTGGMPLNLFVSFDKHIAGFFLIAILFYRHSKVDLLRVFANGVLWSLIAILFLIPLSIMFGYVTWDPKLSSFALVWMVVNFLSCISEEVLFRGFIQSRLISLFHNCRWSNCLGLSFASILFGLLHYPGGMKYVFLATAVGIIYGVSYLKTKSIETTILAHFIFNIVHFTLFTYPALSSAF